MARTIASIGATVACIILTATAATAQAVCSAPHSSPTLAQGGTIATLDPGAGWVQLSLYAQNADDRFDSDGFRTPFFAGGEASTRSAYVTLALGILEGVDVWAQAAVHRLRYADQAGVRERTGLGDLRIATRLGTELIGWHAPFTLRAGLKLPGSRFPVDATVLPLSEGQTDAELSVETGRAFAGGAVYALSWVGHRWRFGRTSTDREPGDEWFAHGGLGGRYRTLRWELAAEALWGQPPTQQGLTLTTDRRRMLQLSPSFAWAIGPGEADLGIQAPLVGRNLPSDPGVSLGYRVAW
ncbi:MAG: hypothetical protein ACRELD_13520 [Longimicrobiales bacterium]